eukprot:Filipodium_phascolosomae@DN4577_c0_g1_i1.p1
MASPVAALASTTSERSPASSRGVTLPSMPNESPIMPPIEQRQAALDALFALVADRSTVHTSSTRIPLHIGVTDSGDNSHSTDRDESLKGTTDVTSLLRPHFPVSNPNSLHTSPQDPDASSLFSAHSLNLQDEASLFRNVPGSPIQAHSIRALTTPTVNHNWAASLAALEGQAGSVSSTAIMMNSSVHSTTASPAVNLIAPGTSTDMLYSVLPFPNNPSLSYARSTTGKTSPVSIHPLIGSRKCSLQSLHEPTLGGVKDGQTGTPLGSAMMCGVKTTAASVSDIQTRTSLNVLGMTGVSPDRTASSNLVDSGANIPLMLHGDYSALLTPANHHQRRTAGLLPPPLDFSNLLGTPNSSTVVPLSLWPFFDVNSARPPHAAEPAQMPPTPVFSPTRPSANSTGNS